MWSLILALPLELAADRLEVGRAGWWAEAVQLKAADLTLRADSARGWSDAACSAGRLRLLGPVAAERGDLRARADELELCLPGEARAHRLRVEGPALRLAAAEAHLAGDQLTATHLEATACTCPAPPWRLTARQADLTLGEGGWAEWPVLWVGPVPVATAPRWYVPLARRQTGFLFPIVGFDGEDGFHARQPLFITLGDSADLTLAPGYRDGAATGHTRLRWAATPDDHGLIDTRFTRDGGALEGRGSLPLGPAHLALEGIASTDEAVRRALWPGLAARHPDHLRGTAGLGFAGRRTGIGLRALRLDDRRPTATRDATIAPDLWLEWDAAAGPAEITLQGRSTTVLDGGQHTLADIVLEAEIPFWIEMLALRPQAGFATTVHLDDGQQTGAAWVGGEARVAVARPFGALRHELALVLDARLAEARDPVGTALLPIDLPLSSQALGLTLETRLASRTTTARLALRGGHEAAAPVEGFEQPLLTFELDHPDVQLDGGTAGTEATWAHFAAETTHLRLSGGLTRLRPSARTPTLRRLGPGRPLAVSTLTGDLTTAEAGLGFTVGRLAVDYTAVADVDGETLLGHEAGLAYTSGCDCWSARLALSHERDRDAPDVWLALTVP